MWKHNKRIYAGHRRRLRLGMTDAERVLWSYLRGKRIKGRRFRRQEGIGNYIVDFYCHQEKLIIEVDGGVHFLKQQIAYDEKRSAYLNSGGYKILRFTNEEVFSNINNVLERITASFNES